MKNANYPRMIFCLLIAGLFSFITTHGQNSFLFNDPKKIPGLFGDTTKNGLTKEEFKQNHLNSFGIRSVRQFDLAYPDAEEVRWFETDEGAVVHFRHHGVEMKMGFDTKGSKLYTYYYYYLSKDFPEEIQDIFSCNYRGFNIVSVFRFDLNERTQYEVKLENSSKIVIVKILDGNLMDKGKFTRYYAIK